MPTKQSQAALIRLVEEAIRNVGQISSNRFYIAVQDLTVFGSPPTHIDAMVWVRFLPSGAPFCCGEPGCYSRAFRDEGAEEIGEYLRRQMNLRHTVTVTLACRPEYFDGIQLTAFSSAGTEGTAKD